MTTTRNRPALLAGLMYASLHVDGLGLPDAVVFAAESSTPEARRIASELAARLAVPLRVATSAADAAAAVTALRSHGARRVAVTAYLASDGQSYAALRGVGADHVTEPLGLHPTVVKLRLTLAEPLAVAS